MNEWTWIEKRRQKESEKERERYLINRDREKSDRAKEQDKRPGILSSHLKERTAEERSKVVVRTRWLCPKDSTHQ